MPGLVSRTMLSRLGPGLSGPFPPALNEGGFCDRPTGQAPHWAEANRKAHPATIVLGGRGETGSTVHLSITCQRKKIVGHGKMHPA